MDTIVFRKGEQVILRPIERADAPTLRRWMNDPKVTQYLLRSFPLMEKEEEEWVENLSKDKNNFALAVILTENRRFIGTIGLHQIRWPHRTAITGTTIGEKDCWGKGYGTEAKMLLLDFAFNTLDLYAVISYVMESNERSLAYGKKCGYREVGRLPKCIRRSDGVRCDEVVLMVSQEEWHPLWTEYLKNRKSPK